MDLSESARDGCLSFMHFVLFVYISLRLCMAGDQLSCCCGIHACAFIKLLALQGETSGTSIIISVIDD